MEFLRFAGNIGGSYWGCCACDVIQNFNVDPDAKASIQIIEGDGGTAQTNAKGEVLFAGPTYRDIFHQRLRFGTFSTRDMPNHAFLAIITASQIQRKDTGAKWLTILREAGFEFIRTINNSVYTGANLTDKPTGSVHGNSANYLFGLFRNIGAGHADNPFMPPKAWTDMQKVAPEPWDFLQKFGTDLDGYQQKVMVSQRKIYDALPRQSTLKTEAELVKDSVPIWLAGKRGGDIQRMKPKVAPPPPSASAASPVIAPIAG